MIAAADVGQSVVASILALGTAGLAGAIVAMVWWLQWAQVQRGGRLDGQQAAGPSDDALPHPGMPSPGIPAPGMPLTDMPASGMRANGGPAMVSNGNGVANGTGAPRSPAGAPVAAAQAAQAGDVRPGPAAPSAIEG